MLKTKTQSDALMDRRSAVVSNGVGMFNTVTVASAKGAIITDVDGNEWIDFAGGIGVVNAGHCPDLVIVAITSQVQKFIHTSFNVVTYEPYIELCEKLVELLPHGEHTKAALFSTGAEAVENAVKIAKQATGRSGIICFSDAFHGRTLMAMTLTSKVDYKLNSGPYAPEVYRLPFPNFYRYGLGMTEADFVEQELRRLRTAFRDTVAPGQVAAIIIELVQGEGGFNVAPEAYVQGLRQICDEQGIMLVFDEVQSGFCRTGKWGSYQHYADVMPDLSVWAKSLASGLPISAVLGRADVMDAAKPGTIGGTYIGTPLACVAALATIKFMEDNHLNHRADVIGSTMLQRFLKMQLDCPAIGDVRGLGAMIAMEFVKNGDPQQPDAELTKALVEGCAARNLILLSAGTHKNIIRILVPLVIHPEELNRGLDIIEAVLNELA